MGCQKRLWGLCHGDFAPDPEQSALADTAFSKEIGLYDL